MDDTEYWSEEPVRASPEDIGLVMNEIERAARKVALKWPQITSEEDMVQSLVLHFLERLPSLQVLVELPTDKRLGRLTAIGHEKASAQRDDLEVFSGSFSYSVDEVRRLLERGALDGHVDNFDAGVEDVLQGMEALRKKNSNYAMSIISRYQTHGEPNRVTLSRGLESLTTLMNRIKATERYEFTNGGRFRNNRQALNQADLDYEGQGRYDD